MSIKNNKMVYCGIYINDDLCGSENWHLKSCERQKNTKSLYNCFIYFKCLVMDPFKRKAFEFNFFIKMLKYPK